MVWEWEGGSMAFLQTEESTSPNVFHGIGPGRWVGAGGGNQNSSTKHEFLEFPHRPGKEEDGRVGKKTSGRQDVSSTSPRHMLMRKRPLAAAEERTVTLDARNTVLGTPDAENACHPRTASLRLFFLNQTHKPITGHQIWCCAVGER